MLSVVNSSDLNFFEPTDRQDCEIKLTSIKENRSRIFRDMTISIASQLKLDFNRKDLYTTLVSQQDECLLLQDRDRVYFLDMKNSRVVRLSSSLDLSEKDVKVMYIHSGRFIVIDRENYYFIDVENQERNRSISADGSSIDILELDSENLFYISYKDSIDLYDSSFNLIDSGITSITDSFYLKNGEIFSLKSRRKIVDIEEKEEKLVKSIFSSKKPRKNNINSIVYLSRNKTYIFESQNLGVISSKNIQLTAFPNILLFKDSNIVLDIDTAIAYRYQTEVKLSDSKFPVISENMIATPYGALVLDDNVNEIQTVYSNIYSRATRKRYFLIEGGRYRYFFNGSSLFLKSEDSRKFKYRYDLFLQNSRDQEYRFIAIYRDDLIFLINEQKNIIYTVDISKYDKTFVEFKLREYQPEKEKIIYTLEYYPSHKSVVKEINIIEQSPKEERLIGQFHEDESSGLFFTYSYRNLYKIRKTDSHTVVDISRIPDDCELYYSINGDSYVLKQEDRTVLNYRGEDITVYSNQEAEIIYNLLERGILIIQDSSRDVISHEENFTIINRAGYYFTFLNDRYLVIQSSEERKYRVIDLTEKRVLDKVFSSIYIGEKSTILLEEDSRVLRMLELKNGDTILELEKDRSPEVSISVDID